MYLHLHISLVKPRLNVRLNNASIFFKSNQESPLKLIVDRLYTHVYNDLSGSKYERKEE